MFSPMQRERFSGYIISIYIDLYYCSFGSADAEVVLTSQTIRALNLYLCLHLIAFRNTIRKNATSNHSNYFICPFYRFLKKVQ